MVSPSGVPGARPPGRTEGRLPVGTGRLGAELAQDRIGSRAGQAGHLLDVAGGHPRRRGLAGQQRPHRAERVSRRGGQLAGPLGRAGVLLGLLVVLVASVGQALEEQVPGKHRRQRWQPVHQGDEPAGRRVQGDGGVEPVEQDRAASGAGGERPRVPGHPTPPDGLGDSGALLGQGVESGGGHERLKAQRPQVGRPSGQAGGSGDAVQDRVGQRHAVGEHRHGGGAAGPLDRGVGPVPTGPGVLAGVLARLLREIGSGGHGIPPAGQGRQRSRPARPAATTARVWRAWSAYTSREAPSSTSTRSVPAAGHGLHPS